LQQPSLYGAIEAGGTKFSCAVGFSAEKLVAAATFPTTTPDDTLGKVIDFFRSASSEFGELARIGIGSFGPVDVHAGSPTYGRILQTPKPGWSNTSYHDYLAVLRTPLTIDTDVNVAALGEYCSGALVPTSAIAYVTVGTGIGVGVVRDGASLAGISHYEMGHIRPPRDLLRDPFEGCCPFHGDCLEGLASGPAIIKRWGLPLSQLDSGAIELEAEYLANLCLTIILTHMPERIALGGGVMKTNGLIECVRQTTAELLAGYLSVAPIDGDLQDYICAPTWGDRAGVLGALTLAERSGNRQ